MITLVTNTLCDCFTIKVFCKMNTFNVKQQQYEMWLNPADLSAESEQ